jgi:acetyl esterase/lipase
MDRSRGAWVAGLIALVALAGCASDSGARTAAPTSTAVTSTSAPVPPTSVVVPVKVPARTGDIGPTKAAELAPVPKEVAYGADPMQRMDVYATSGDSLGTIMYVHGGGWNGGSKDANTAPLVLSTQADLRDTASPLLAEVDETAGERLIFAQIQNGWDVVSIDYRLATPTPGDGIRAAEILNDVDRAVRYTRAHAAELGLNMDKFVLAGGSAGGHLALMETLGAPSRAFADPTLPPELASTDPHIDATIALVAPTDLSTFWQAGGIAPPSSESLLGCTQDAVPAIPGMPACNKQVVDEYSPLVWSRRFVSDGRSLPPAYFAYGGEDTLVKIETQGTPNIDAWANAAGPERTWVDLPPAGGHNIDDTVNYIAFNAFLARVASGNWPTRSAPSSPPTTSHN